MWGMTPLLHQTAGAQLPVCGAELHRVRGSRASGRNKLNNDRRQKNGNPPRKIYVDGGQIADRSGYNFVQSQRK